MGAPQPSVLECFHGPQLRMEGHAVRSCPRVSSSQPFSVMGPILGQSGSQKPVPRGPEPAWLALGTTDAQLCWGQQLAEAGGAWGRSTEA